MYKIMHRMYDILKAERYLHLVFVHIVSNECGASLLTMYVFPESPHSQLGIGSKFTYNFPAVDM